MKMIQRLTTAGLVLLTLAGARAGAQDGDAYNEEMRRGDRFVERRQYQLALDAYKHAFALTKKSSSEAALAMAVAYRGLGAWKNSLDAASDALKLAGEDSKRQADAHNVRGSALFALSDKPGDKKMREAETEFRAALAANATLASARYNLALTLMKLDRDEEGLREMQIYVDRAPGGTDTTNAKRILADPRRAHVTFAPDFSFVSREGHFFSLDALKGKAVLLDFWGSWCGPCVKSVPDLVRLHKKFAEQSVVFLGIAKDQQPAWERFIDRNKLDWPQYLDESQTILHDFKITGFPTYIVLDGEGIIRWRSMGYAPGNEHAIENAIKDALKREP
jgi:thiol-disulfide isomerase/thioredoxin